MQSCKRLFHWVADRAGFHVVYVATFEPAAPVSARRCRFGAFFDRAELAPASGLAQSGLACVLAGTAECDASQEHALCLGTMQVPASVCKPDKGGIAQVSVPCTEGVLSHVQVEVFTTPSAADTMPYPTWCLSQIRSSCLEKVWDGKGEKAKQKDNLKNKSQVASTTLFGSSPSKHAL